MSWEEGNISNNAVVRFVVLALVTLLLLLPACAGPSSASANVIAKKLICQCGCGDVLSTCDCETADEMTALIKKKLGQGQSEKQIIQYFVDRYGERVLAPR